MAQNGMAQSGMAHQLQPLQTPKLPKSYPESYQQPHRGKEQSKDAYAIGDIYERLSKSKIPRNIWL